MNEQEARNAPLSEVWDRFKAALDMIELDDPNAPDTTMGGKWGTPPGEYGRMAAKMVPMMHNVLLERCKRVDDVGGQSSEFTVDGRTVLIENSIDRLRHDNPETLANFIAACEFWLRELEQRGKDGNNG